MDKGPFSNGDLRWFGREEQRNLIDNFDKRNIICEIVPDSNEARKLVLEMIPEGSKVGISGSLTLRQIGLIDSLSTDKYVLYNQYLKELSKVESMDIRKRGSRETEYFLSSVNAITKDGVMVAFSAMGNRIAGITNSPKTIIVAGINKLVENIEEAMERARNYVAPKNSRRLNMNTPCINYGHCMDEMCRFPDYQRICCQLLTIEGEWEKGRLTVILVKEPLGF